MQPEISIVLPVYNVKEYLDECIKSILNQSFLNFELIIINDGSTDNSLEICERYRLLDKRIKLFSRKNKGVSRTRNEGIDLAVGDYIVFVDSDDILKKDYLLKLYHVVEVNQCDMVISGYINNKLNREISPQFSLNCVQTGKELILSYPKIHTNNELCFSWRCLYKSSYLKNNHIKFHEKISIGEDFLFNFQAFLCSERVIAIPDCLYIYRTDNLNSTMRRNFKPNLEESLIEQYELRKIISESYNLLSNESYLQDMAKYYIYNIYRLLVNNAKQNSEEQFKDSLKRIINLDLIKENISLLKVDLRGVKIKEYIYLLCLKYRFYILLLYLESRH